MIKTIQKFSKPFSHFSIESVFSSSVLADINAASLSNLQWSRNKNDFFRFWSTNKPIITDIEDFSHTFWRNEYPIIVKDTLGVEIYSPPTFDILKLEHGDGIGIHDDKDILAVRTVIKLFQSRETSYGGHFILFDDNIDNTIIYALEENSGVSFAAKPQNIHAISNVIGSPAFYLILQNQIAQ